jgi:hypothetical protein
LWFGWYARVRLQIVQACKFAVFKSSHSTDYWWQRYRLTILATLCMSCKGSSNFRSLTSQIHQCWIELQMIKLELCVNAVISSSKNQSVFEWLTRTQSKGRIWNVDWFFEERSEICSFWMSVLYARGCNKKLSSQPRDCTYIQMWYDYWFIWLNWYLFKLRYKFDHWRIMDLN